MPDQAAVAAARIAAGTAGSEPIGGSRQNGAFAETWTLEDVECQVAFHTIERQERDMATALQQWDPATPLHKAMSGLLEGVPVRGSDVIDRWNRQAADYPTMLPWSQ